MSEQSVHVEVHRDRDGYWAQVREWPGCSATARTWEELIAALEESIALYTCADDQGEPTQVTVRIVAMELEATGRSSAAGLRALISRCYLRDGVGTLILNGRSGTCAGAGTSEQHVLGSVHERAERHQCDEVAAILWLGTEWRGASERPAGSKESTACGSQRCAMPEASGWSSRLQGSRDRRGSHRRPRVPPRMKSSSVAPIGGLPRSRFMGVRYLTLETSGVRGSA